MKTPIHTLNQVSSACLVGMVSTSLMSCNSSTPASRALPTTTGSTTASVRVSDGSQPVQIGSSSSALNLTLPAGALTSLISQLGPVSVTAKAGAVGSLSAADQAAVQAGTRTGARVLSTIQMDVAAAGGATKSFRVQQAATTGTLSFSEQVGADGSCPSNSIVTEQLVNGQATLLLGKAYEDKATHQQLSGSATATFGDRHLVFFFQCLPTNGLQPHALVTGNPVPRPVKSSPPAASLVGIPTKFMAPANPFTISILGTILTVTDTDFTGQEDQFFQDSTIGATVTNYNFDVSGKQESLGGQDQSASAQVAVTGQGTHQIVMDEELFPVMSDAQNVLSLTDKTTGKVLTVTADQELQNITVMQGNQLAVMRAKHLTTEAIKATTTNLTLTNNPDGTWLINGQGASTAQAAAQLVLQSPIASGASLHGLVALLGLLTNQQFLIPEPTLSPSDCNYGQRNVDTYYPLPNVVVSAHGEFTVKQAALPPTARNLVQLVKAIIQQMEQNLQTQRERAE